VTAIKWSHDGKLLASLSTDNTILLWKPESVKSAPCYRFLKKHFFWNYCETQTKEKYSLFFLPLFVALPTSESLRTFRGCRTTHPCYTWYLKAKKHTFNLTVSCAYNNLLRLTRAANSCLWTAVKSWVSLQTLTPFMTLWLYSSRNPLFERLFRKVWRLLHVLNNPPVTVSFFTPSLSYTLFACNLLNAVYTLN
jgi:WD40 repeat protein